MRTTFRNSFNVSVQVLAPVDLGRPDSGAAMAPGVSIGTKIAMTRVADHFGGRRDGRCTTGARGCADAGVDPRTSPARARDLLHEPADRRAGQHHRERRAAGHPARPARVGLRSAVDDRRLHAGAGEPADAVRLDRRPDRPPAHVPDRPRDLHARLVAVQPRARPRLADRLPRSSRRSAEACSTRWRCRSSPTCSPSPRERAQAIGIWGGVVGISLALGPVVGGALIDSIGWRSIFWINIPVGVAAFVLTALFVPESRAAAPRRIDVVGQVLVFAFLLTLTYGIIEGPAIGWASPVDRRLRSWPRRSRWLALVAYERRRYRAADRPAVLLAACRSRRRR